MEYGSVKKIIENLKKFPGISFRHSEKMAFALLQDAKLQKAFNETAALLGRLTRCKKCGWYAEADTDCENCNRDQSAICVVESFSDMMVIEKTGEFTGSYHILGGLISPLEGVMPDDLLARPLAERAKEHGAAEIILALSSTIEGEATVSYIKDMLADAGVSAKITRIARGIPSGSRLESADKQTVAFAIKDRHTIS